MKITQHDLDWAVEQGLLTQEQGTALWSALSSRNKHRPKFDLIHLGYYAGALIVILAMGWFLAISWQPFGHAGILLISSLYALVFTLVGKYCWSKEDLKTPGGLLTTLAVCMTPLIVYGIEQLTGLWPQETPGIYRGAYSIHASQRGDWFLMEVATIAASLTALRFVRFPFLLAPLSFTLWYMSIDMTPFLFSKNEYSWDERLYVCLFFGAVMLVIAYIVDLRRKTVEDYAFWLYLFGMFSFWGGMQLHYKGSEVAELVVCAVNLALMLLSVLLQRKVFLIFGAIGVIAYLSHLAYVVFKDWMMFPIALSGIGLGIIYLAVRYQKNQEHIEARVKSWVPESMRKYLPAYK